MAGTKREPIPHAVDPGGADQLGQKVGTVRAVEPLYEGRGFKAPEPAGRTIHHSGSQGHHK